MNRKEEELEMLIRQCTISEGERKREGVRVRRSCFLPPLIRTCELAQIGSWAREPENGKEARSEESQRDQQLKKIAKAAVTIRPNIWGKEIVKIKT